MFSCNIYNRLKLYITMIHITKIYLVTNCYNNPNKVYIGKTIKSREQPHRATYGKQIEYTVIDQIDGTDRKKWGPLETYWIQQFIAWGFEVVNKNKKGGGGPEFCSPEHKLKTSLSLTGLKRTPETKSRQSEALKGKPKPEGTGEKISIALVGKKQKEGAGLKKSEALKDKPKPEGFSNKCKLYKNHITPVLQKTLTGEIVARWDTITLACITLWNKPNRACGICECCKGNAYTAFGYVWEYC